MDRIRIKGKHEVTNLATSPKHLLFLVCDLLAVIGPAPLEHVAFYVSRILGEEPGYDIASLLSLAEAIGILRTFQSLNGVVFYCRPLSNGQLYSFTYLKEGLNLSVERAKHLNAMQRIQAARAVIRLVGRL